MEKFDETDIALYHLIFLGNSIEKTFQAFGKIIDKVPQDAEMALYASTSSLIIIQTKSFLDEYREFITSKDPELLEVIKSIKATVKPALKTINGWKDLEAFRNQVLAHNLRDRKKNNESVFARGITSYDIPQQGADLHVLISCVGMIKDIFQSAFREKLALVQQRLDAASLPKALHRYTRENFEEVIEAVRHEINANVRKLKESHEVL